MSVTASIEVAGLKDALKVINQVDPKTRRAITKEFKNIADPVIRQAQSEDLSRMALSGFSRKWVTKSGYQMFPINEQKLDKFIVAGTSGKKPKEFRGNMQNASVFFIRWKSSQATLLEMAAKGEMGRNLTNKTGLPKGRLLWRSWDQHEAEVVAKLDQLVKDVMRWASKAARNN